MEGGCHCGALRYTVQVTLTDEGKIPVVECNCSICTQKGFLHLIVPSSRFEFQISPSDVLGTYTFGTHVAKHHFCKRCSLGPWYVPRSNPDGFSINARSLDKFRDIGLSHSNMKEFFALNPFDGQDFENSIQETPLAHLSQDSPGQDSQE